MKIIISPAKKMKEDADTLAGSRKPVFIEETGRLLAYLRTLCYEEAKTLWNCNDQIAHLNYARIQNMDLSRARTPAVIAYEGLQYQHMAPAVMEEQELSYLEDHLRILSGFYGVLRPLDVVMPYRMEMQAQPGGLYEVSSAEDPVKKPVRSMYEFWKDKPARAVYEDEDCVLNLASREYSRCITPFVPDNAQFVTCLFGEWKNGRIIEKGTMAKMARGEMVRYLAGIRAENPQDARGFSELGYRYEQKYSDTETLVFIRQI